MSRRRQLSARSLRVLAVALLVFICTQLVLSGILEFVRPDLRDPEFGPRVQRLRAARDQKPRRLAVVALGSSRTLMGLRPAALELDGERAFACNLAQFGSGPQE